MFWRSGLLNARRNLSRSGLMLLSMALAAGFYTHVMSLSRGYAQLYKADYRFIAGGEINAYAPQFSGLTPDDDVTWYYQPPLFLQTTDLDRFRPDVLNVGFLTSEEISRVFSSQIVEAIAAVEGIAAVSPYYRMPALLVTEYGQRQVALRGRELRYDRQQAKPPEALVGDGRWFNEEDEGQLVAVVSSRQHYDPGEKMAGVGDVLCLKIPTVTSDYAYYEQSRIVELTVVGIIDAASRMYDGGASINEFYQLVDEIQIPQSTWAAVWEQSSAEPFAPSQLSLIVPDISYLEDTVSTLRMRFPKHSFFSVPQLAEEAERKLLTEKASDLPPVLRDIAARTRNELQVGLPPDLRLPLTALVFLNAALVVASNLLIMANKRREEMGILKTLGATRSNVIHMVLSEALCIAGLGASCGFLFFRVPAMLNQVTNGQRWPQLLWSFSADLLLVYAVTGIAVFVFALIPAARMASVSVLDAFRND